MFAEAGGLIIVDGVMVDGVMVNGVMVNGVMVNGVIVNVVIVNVALSRLGRLRFDGSLPEDDQGDSDGRRQVSLVR